MKKFLAIVLALIMALSLVACGSKANVVEKAVNGGDGKYAGKTVILHSNDVHGAIEGYSYMAATKAAVEAEGGTAILVDDGDFTNGNIYVSISKGESAVTLMNQVGYDVVGLGNHELDFGYDQLMSNLSVATFNTICSNVYKDGKTIFNANVIYKVGDMKIGFFGLLTPETQTKVNPANIQGLSFTEKEDLYKAAQAQVDELTKEKCDIIICLAHLGIDDESVGNRSIEVMENVTGIDFVIDGHSHSVLTHTVVTPGAGGTHIQSTGTEFANIGAIIIDNSKKAIVSNDLWSTAGMDQDAEVLATAKNITDTVDEEFGATFAKTSVLLDGEKPHVRSVETNMGDLIADSMVWSVTNETELEVDVDHVVAVTNGGGIRATIEAGGISRSDVKTVLPFGNTIAVNYVTGAELLEALEASCCVTPETLGGFPQIAGMKITIDTTKEFDGGDEYPGSTYQCPNSIKRVTITEVNGQPFDANATYAVVTNNFCAAGGDTYYAFKRAYDAGNGFDTSIPLDEGLVAYIMAELGCEIGSQYAEPAGRIQVIAE